MLKCTDCHSEIEPGRQGDVKVFSVVKTTTVRGKMFTFAYADLSVTTDEYRPRCLPCTESHARAKGAWREEEAS